VVTPIMKRQIDKGAAAYAEGDLESLGRANWLFLKCDQMIDRPPYASGGGPGPFIYSSRAEYNQEPDFAWLMAAAADFRRGTGRWPEAISELTPDYLDASFFNEPDVFWEIVPMASRTIPVLTDRSEKEAVDYFTILADRYKAQHGKWPVSIDDLKPLAGEGADLEQFRGRFTELEGRPVFVMFRIEDSADGAQRIFMSARTPIMPLVPDDPFAWLADDAEHDPAN
jgi:hypothetical protein